MTETENPFIHPAQVRFQELLDEAEEMALEQTAARPLHDPFEPYHLARDWGIDPWVMRAVEMDQHVSTLRAEATSFAPDNEGARLAFKETAVGALQALVLFEEQVNGDQELDDQQLAGFLEKLVAQLDSRIERLRRPPLQGPVPEGDPPPNLGEAPEKVEVPLLRQEDEDELDPWSTPEVARRSEDFLDPDVQPGLAFTGAHGDVVAGEGPVQDPPAGVDTGEYVVQPEDLEEDQDRSMNVGPGPEPQPARQSGRLELDQSPLATSDEMPPPVDLDAAERAHAREIVALKQEAAGSSARVFGGRHASPEATDPNVTQTGRH